jgi:hypothetical protein
VERQTKRTIWFAAIGLAVLVALVVIALVRDPVQLDPASPEGTVQAYLQAIADEDYGAALALLEPGLADGCSPSDLQQAAPREPFSATLVDSDESNDTASVTASIAYSPSPGPFDPGSNGFDEYFSLVLLDGVWRIINDPWPYYVWSCQ